MCGRYAFDDIKDIYEARKILEEIASRLGQETADSVKTGEIFPSERAAVLAQSENGFIADVMEWGYPIKDSKRLVINARSESAGFTGMFRNCIENKKCLVPCTGYFEWKESGNGKIKYSIKPEGEDFFYLAGLYDSFRLCGAERKRFVILTRGADTQIIDIHSRMPVIVRKSDINSWLSEGLHPEKIKNIINRTDKFSVEKASGK